jgi:hypothetical protein
MDKDTAQRVDDLLQGAVRAVMDSVAIVAQRDPAALPEYRRSAGRVLGILMDDLLGKVWAEHRELAPPDPPRGEDGHWKWY